MIEDTGIELDLWQTIYAAQWAGIHPREVAAGRYELDDCEWAELIIFAYLAQTKAKASIAKKG